MNTACDASVMRGHATITQPAKVRAGGAHRKEAPPHAPERFRPTRGSRNDRCVPLGTRQGSLQSLQEVEFASDGTEGGEGYPSKQLTPERQLRRCSKPAPPAPHCGLRWHQSTPPCGSHARTARWGFEDGSLKATHACLLKSPYGRRPMPPSSVMVSPLMNLKSGLASCTQARPISSSGSA